MGRAHYITDVSKVFLLWLFFASIFPILSFVATNTNVLGYIFYTKEGWLYMGTCLLTSLLTLPVLFRTCPTDAS